MCAFGSVRGLSQCFGGLRQIDLLRQVAQLLATHQGPVGAEHFFGSAGLVVPETRVPTEQDLLVVLHGHAHGVRHFAPVLPDVHTPPSMLTARGI